MKKRTFTNIMLVGLLFASMLLISACGVEAEDEVPAVSPISIAISIDYPAKTKLEDVTEVPFRIEEDSTVLQVIELYGNINEIPILIETTEGTLEGINGVQNGILAKTYQWKYKVNGKLINKNIDEKVLEDGDLLEFVYVKQ